MKKLVGKIINTYSVFNICRAVKIAYGLFATPRKGKIKGDLPDFLKKATSGKLTFDLLELQVYSWNNSRANSQTILLVHGWQSNTNRWEALCKGLPRNYNWVGVDAPCQGKSQGTELSVYQYSQVLQEVIKEFNPQIIIAHSLGAFAVLDSLSNKQNPFLEKIILLGALDKFEHIVWNYFNMMGYNKKLQERFISYIESIIGKDLSEYASYLFVENITAKFLVIHDKNDCVVPLEKSLNLHRELQKKNAEIIYTHNSDHSLQNQTVYTYIYDFITQQE
ncbi:alpha/beta hydrolase [Myroides sp. LJL110]